MVPNKYLQSALVLVFLLALVLGVGVSRTHAETDPITVVQEYYGAYNKGDIDKAISYLANDVVFINPTGTYVGLERARENLEGIKKDGLTFELSDFQNNNGRVTYAYKVLIGGDAVENGSDGLTIVKDGKIVFDGTVSTEKQLPTAGAALPATWVWLALGGAALGVLGGVLFLRKRAA